MKIDHMLKHRERGYNCDKCMGYYRHKMCCEEWEKEIGRTVCGDGFDCCYANRDQVEYLLKYWDEKNGTIQEYNASLKEVEDKDFRVGDPVTYVGKRLRFESTVSKVNVDRVEAKSDISGVIYFFDKAGFRHDGRLYHGHNVVKITVEEKKPVRTRTGWVFTYQRSDGEIRSLPRETPNIETCRDTIRAYIQLGNNVLTGPIKVEIPE